MYPINLGMCRKERKGMSAPGASKGVDNKSTEQEPGEIAPITGVVRHSKFSATTAAMGQTRTSSLRAARPLPPSADIGPGGRFVGQAARFCLAASAAATHWTIAARFGPSRHLSVL
jgi:hypothetical protein